MAQKTTTAQKLALVQTQLKSAWTYYGLEHNRFEQDAEGRHKIQHRIDYLTARERRLKSQLVGETGAPAPELWSARDYSGPTRGQRRS